MKKHIGVLSGLCGLAGLVSTSAARAELPPYFYIERISYRGAACPQGTASADILDNGTSFLVTYNAFQAQAGPGLPVTESSKTCTLTIDLHYPDGWTWTVADIVYRGNATLADKVNARIRLRYAFPGIPSVSQDAELKGPSLGDFELRQSLDLFAWAPCRPSGQTFPMTINATGMVNNTAAPSRSGLLTVEQTDGSFKVLMHLNWVHCQ